MIDLSIVDEIATVVLNAPDRLNALDETGLRELGAAYDRAQSAGVRALVLRGEGRAFCAGRDISAVDPATDDVPGYLDGLLAPLLRRMAAFPAPTFAAAHGACLGVGLGLLIATDVVYVADTAKIGSPFAGLGATLDSGGHALFAERLGAHKTLDLIYTGRLMTGAEAVQSGLFSRVLAADEVLPAIQDAAARAAHRTHVRVPREQASRRAHPRRAPLAVGRHRRGERGADGPQRHGRLPRGLRRVPGEARADVPRPLTLPATPLRRASLSAAHPSPPRIPPPRIPLRRASLTTARNVATRCSRAEWNGVLRLLERKRRVAPAHLSARRREC